MHGGAIISDTTRGVPQQGTHARTCGQLRGEQEGQQDCQACALREEEENKRHVIPGAHAVVPEGEGPVGAVVVESRDAAAAGVAVPGAVCV